MRLKSVPFRPALEGTFAFRFYQTVNQAISGRCCADIAQFGALVRREVAWSQGNETVNPTQRTRYRACWLVLRDLQRIGWTLAWHRNTLLLTPPVLSSQHLAAHEILQQKELVQNAMSHARLARLRQYSDFVHRMESKPPQKGLAFLPVTAVIADGQSLSADLRKVVLGTTRNERANALRLLVQPYLQLVEEKERCKYTGHLLSDLWRYFRFTWSNPPESTPGRTMLYLVRDAARPNHPVMGLFSLENSALRIRCRDHYLRWTPESLADRLSGIGTSRELRSEIQKLLKSVDDCLKDIDPTGLCRQRDLIVPTALVIRRLMSVGRKADDERVKAVAAWLEREDEGDVDHDKRQQSTLGNISVEAEKALYRRKRAAQLARLLSAKRQLRTLLSNKPLRKHLQGFLSGEDGLAALRSCLIAIKNRHIGTSMLELNVCGAIPPYNHLLGGKLAALLALSPTIVADYRRRYGNRPSDIASLMKGKAVVRPAELVYVGTSSLYVAGTSQYNRLKLPATLFPKTSHTVEWLRLGETEGFGTMHIGQDTVSALDELVRSTGVRRTNYVFGEGASPKFRTIRAGLEAILEPGQRSTANALARHAMRRIVYGAWIAANGAEYVTGQAKTPSFYFDGTREDVGTRRLIDFWIDRWLAMRLDHEPSLTRLDQFKARDLLVSRALDATPPTPVCAEENRGIA